MYALNFLREMTFKNNDVKSQSDACMGAERIEARLIEQMKLIKTGQKFRCRKRRACAQFREGCKIEKRKKAHT